MKIAKVTGSIVSTKKEDGLVGSKLMIVRFESSDGVPYGNEEVAVDYVGAGIGELVLVASGSAPSSIFDFRSICRNISFRSSSSIDYDTYRGKGVNLFDAQTNRFGFVFNTDAQRFSTNDYYFTPVALTDSTVTMQLNLGNDVTSASPLSTKSIIISSANG